MRHLLPLFLLAACGPTVTSSVTPLFSVAAPVRDMGYCADVSAAACPVRPWWPYRDIAASTAVDAYWLADDHGRVCFVELRRYREAAIGAPATCIWREHRP
jgi:hypothetical protein